MSSLILVTMVVHLGKVKSTKKGLTVQWAERVIAGLNISLNLCQL